ncbi:MAG: GntR family transcriptional regulator [Xanthobacteraceae bacterium]|jgi:DNA-binding GntR family transcriptional regulator
MTSQDTSIALPMIIRPRALVRRTLPDELVGHLREMISSGQLRAGGRISVARLCRRFGVSRTPLREALKVLAVEGLVHLSPNKSATVARASRERVDELIPILSALEVLAGEMACTRIDAEGLRHLRLLHQRCVEHFHEGDVASYMEVDVAIRETIFEAAGNRKLIELYRVLYAQLRLSAVLGMAPPEWARAVEEQGQILQALEIKDPEMCSVVTRRYIRHRVAVLQNILEAPSEGDARRTRHTMARVTVDSDV